MTSDDKTIKTKNIIREPDSTSTIGPVDTKFDEQANRGLSEPKTKKASKKPKPVIQSLFEFIQNAYNSKGSRLSFNSKIERNIAKHCRLTEIEEKELLALASKDTLLKISPQLLIITRNVIAYPLLRAGLNKFILNALAMNQIFKQQDILDSLHNLPNSISFDNTVSRILTYTPNGEPTKTLEVRKLRLNAAHSFALYSYNSNNYTLPTFISMLSSAIWEPMSQKLETDTERLRALTDTDKVEGLGFASHQFRKQAREQIAIAEKKGRELEAMSFQKTEIEGQLEGVKRELKNTLIELESLREISEKQKLDLDISHEISLTHLRSDLEKLRSRFVRRLEADLGELETGLSALQSQTPRILVMIQRAESIIDSQRRELDKLKGI